MRVILIFISMFFLSIHYLNAKDIIVTENKVTHSHRKLTYKIPRVTRSPDIDAELAENEWKDAKKIELNFNVYPGDSIPAPVKTTAFMMEDGKNLYLAFKAYDPEPEKILAYFRDRDRLFQDDFVGIIIDTFNDERKGFEFFVNSMGSQADLTRDDVLGDEDSSWNTVWDSAGQVTKEGYVVEMSIPFRALRFSSGLENQLWGIQFLRIYPRDSRMLISDSPKDRKLDCSLCQINKVTGMPQLKSAGVNVDVTPTLTYINSKEREVDPEEPWQRTSDDVETGVDVRWAMSENWILNATVNPDFSQVEADAGQLDVNTTFSLFYPEARPFFLDGADYFNSLNQLVHTRNIADPDYGAKVTGKSGDNSLGVIIASDDKTSFLLPTSEGSTIAELEELSSNILIARGQNNFGEKNTVGVVLTNRNGQDYKNQVAAIDGKFYFSDSDILSYQLMYSDSNNPDAIRYDEDDDDKEVLAASQNDSAIRLEYQHNEDNYNLEASYQDFGKDFRADMGFIGMVDYRKLRLGGEYIWYGENNSSWTQWSIFGDIDRTDDQSDKKLEEEIELHFNIRGPMQFDANLGVVSRERYFDGSYFDEVQTLVFFEFKPLSSLLIGSYIKVGDQVDFEHTQPGKMKLYEPFIEWQVSQHFNIELEYTSNKLSVEAGELFYAKLLDLRLAYQFNIRSRLSLALLGVDIDKNLDLYENNFDNDPDNDVLASSKTVGSQLIYSYKLNPQTLFYMGYSDKVTKNDRVLSLEKTDKTYFAKFSYMWQS